MVHFKWETLPCGTFYRVNFSMWFFPMFVSHVAFLVRKIGGRGGCHVVNLASLFVLLRSLFCHGVHFVI